MFIRTFLCVLSCFLFGDGDLDLGFVHARSRCVVEELLDDLVCVLLLHESTRLLV